MLMQPKICSGNKKTGANIGTWSTLYSNDMFYIPELDRYVQGTCGLCGIKCKAICYVRKSYRYDDVKLRHAINTIALREDIETCFQTLDLQLTRKRKPWQYLRIDQSGEIETLEQLLMFCRLATNHPETPAYIYTKNYEVVIPALLAGLVPECVTVLISIYHEQGIAEYNAVKHLKNVKAFVIDDGFDYSQFGLFPSTTCKAYAGGKLNKNITCDKCEKCMKQVDCYKVIFCNEH